MFGVLLLDLAEDLREEELELAEGAFAAIEVGGAEVVGFWWMDYLGSVVVEFLDSCPVDA